MSPTPRPKIFAKSFIVHYPQLKAKDNRPGLAKNIHVCFLFKLQIPSTAPCFVLKISNSVESPPKEPVVDKPLRISGTVFMGAAQCTMKLKLNAMKTVSPFNENM